MSRKIGVRNFHLQNCFHFECEFCKKCLAAELAGASRETNGLFPRSAGKGFQTIDDEPRKRKALFYSGGISNLCRSCIKKPPREKVSFPQGGFAPSMTAHKGGGVFLSL